MLLLLFDRGSGDVAHHNGDGGRPAQMLGRQDNCRVSRGTDNVGAVC